MPNTIATHREESDVEMAEMSNPENENPTMATSAPVTLTATVTRREDVIAITGTTGSTLYHSNTGSVKDSPARTAFVDQGKCHRYPRGFVVVMIVLVALVAILMVILLSLDVFQKNAGDSTSHHHYHPPPNHYNNASFEGDGGDRQDVIRQRIITLSDPVQFLNPATPQSQALRTLIQQDRMIPFENLTRVTQRYVLLVLVYTCGGRIANVITGTQTTPPAHECHMIEYFQCDRQGELVQLSLARQNLSGPLPQELALLSKLTTFNLAGNQIKGTFPGDILMNLSNLEHLDLSLNAFASSLSTSIGMLTRLRYFSVRGNPDLSGKVPESLRNLRHLQTFDAHFTDLSGPIFDSVIHWHQLEQLNLHSTQFSGTIPPSIGQLTALRLLLLQETRIGGSLPSELLTLTHLEHIHLSGPDWTVRFPNEIDSLTGLVSLAFEGTGFTGTIPTRIGRLRHLQSLMLQRTSLSGTLPSELAQCTSLVNLNVLGLQLYGTIPTEYATLNKLEALTLSQNNFMGSIPFELCRSNLLIIRDCQLQCDCCADQSC